MTDLLYVAGGVAAILLVALIVSYNRFVNQSNLIANSWSNIDTELRRRYDLVPNLVATVRGYAAHERAVLEEVTVARSAALAATGTPEQQARVEQPLVSALRHLLAVSEAYPELRASRHFLSLQQELANTEDCIQAARRFYNANVADYNRRVGSVPSNLVARLFRFREAEYFTIDRAMEPEVAAPPAVG